ncbi:MAG: exosortase system-associated protein, TIGR04073 family [Verrucomicrobia bacterium]|nr:exosortase system-associated protein, TIGR04073 family [Verrucomicrobiota bacterium]
MNINWKRFVIVLGVGVLLCAAVPVQSNAQDAASKLGRGFAGCVLGWLEISGNIYDEGTRNGWLMGATVGFAKGIGMTVVRTLVSVWDLVTFPIPAPDEYNSILKPDYPWGYFTGEGEVTVPASSISPIR